MPDIGVTGGLVMGEKLKEIAAKVGRAKLLRMGFLESAIYPDGTPIAYIAMINEFGATIKKGASTQIIYRKPKRLRKGSKGNRFVKASSKNAVAKEVDVVAHDIIIPARPFFRQTIAKYKNTWGPELAAVLKASNYDAERALALMGKHMGEQLQQAIREFSNPPNAKSTIRKKGFDSPLVDAGTMMNSVSSDVT